MSDQEVKDRIVVPNDEFFGYIISLLESGEKATFTVKGYSMFPFFRNEKDAVCITGYDGRPLEKGDVVLFRFRGKYILHRIIEVQESSGGRRIYRMMGDGNVKGEEYAASDTVYGVMEKRITPSGKEWRHDSRSWRICSSCWMMLRPVRRWLLAVLRRIYR